MAELELTEEFRKERTKELKEVLKGYQYLCTDTDELSRKAANGHQSYIFKYYKKDGDVLIQEVWVANEKQNHVAVFSGLTAVDTKNELFVTMNSDGKYQTRTTACDHASNVIRKGDAYSSIGKIVMTDKDAGKEYDRLVDNIAWQQAYQDYNRAYDRKQDEAKTLNTPVKPIGKDFIRFCKNLPFNMGNRIFYKGEEGYCTRCKQNVSLKGKIKHLSEGKCPSCKKEVTFISRLRNHKVVHDTRCAMKLEKASEGYTLIRFFRVEMTINGDSISPIYDLTERVREFVKEKKVRAYKWNWGKWEYCKTIRGFGGNRIMNIGCNFGKFSSKGGIYTKGLNSLIDSTPFLQHIGFKEFLELKHPEINKQDREIRCISDYLESHAMETYFEWIEKSGFRMLKEKIYEGYGLSESICNIHGKTLPEVFGVDRQTYRRIYERRDTITDRGILVYREFPKLKDAEKQELSLLFKPHEFENIRSILQYTTYHKAMKYIRAQIDSTFNSPSSVLTMWCDYIKMRDTYGEWNKKSNILFFPKYLKKAHDEIMDLNKIKKKEEARKRLAKKIQETYRSIGLSDEEWQQSTYSKILDATQVDRLPVFFKLDKKLPGIHKKYDFSMENGELFVTAPKIAYDIVSEGEIQNICVGQKGMGYIENMAENKAVILFVRRSEEPDKPYYTVEVRNNTIVQVRGKCNCSAKEDVINLLTEYAKKKALKYDAIA
ncbi:PcfJ domain-containing protein [Oribacterium sp. FC2011]|uniref:PcfJ domain-containing protein n=1 Tax=Oribacterium sp. FC2011 TaxID=1408311 RepID=UPI0004E15B50|nr:PcfJ domain-containing protein [Oribacterium sp. FC2011]